MDLLETVRRVRANLAYAEGRLQKIRDSKMPESIVLWYARSVQKRRQRLARLKKRVQSN